MEAVLITLGALGFGAIVIAAYVFTVAARNYVSNDNNAIRNGPAASSEDAFVTRSHADRRKNSMPVTFPMSINGVVVPRERRKSPERRAAA